MEHCICNHLYAARSSECGDFWPTLSKCNTWSRLKFQLFQVVLKNWTIFVECLLPSASWWCFPLVSLLAAGITFCVCLHHMRALIYNANGYLMCWVVHIQSPKIVLFFSLVQLLGDARLLLLLPSFLVYWRALLWCRVDGGMCAAMCARFLFVCVACAYRNILKWLQFSSLASIIMEGIDVEVW